MHACFHSQAQGNIRQEHRVPQNHLGVLVNEIAWRSSLLGVQIDLFATCLPLEQQIPPNSPQTSRRHPPVGLMPDIDVDMPLRTKIRKGLHECLGIRAKPTHVEGFVGVNVDLVELHYSPE